MSAAADTTVAIVGAGGLGGPIAHALAAAGCRLRIADFDVVELSNLQRQVQFATADVGASKAARLAARSGGVAIEARWDAATADAIAGDAAVIVDGTDSPDAKFAVADWAVARGVPYVIAGALRYGGNVFTGAPGTACYRCLFESAPDPDEAPTCADAGDLRHAGTILVVDDLRRGLAPRRVSLRPRAGCTCRAARIASAS